MKYKTVKLGEYLYIKGRIGWKGLKKDEYLTQSDYRIINGESLTEDEIDWSKAGFISKERYDESPEIMLQPDDILLSKDGTIGKIGYVRELMYPTTVASGIFVIRNQLPEKIKTRFIYNFLRSPAFRNFIVARTEGSVIPHLYQKDFVDLDFPLFDLKTQERIVGILDVINDKIDINKTINNNLQQQALVLFSEYISSPLATKNGVIGNYCSVKSGFAFKSTWWTDKGLHVVKIKTIDNDTLNLADCSYVDQDKLSYATDFTVSGGDLLIAMTGATIGKFAIVPKVSKPLLVNQRVGKFFLGSNPLARLPFIFCTLKQPDIISELINRGQGSAQPNISGGDIMSVKCYMPAQEIIDNFNSLLCPIFETIIENEYQNLSLGFLRDTLLPKLMSGEIDVSKVEI